ncbi:MAG: hypothetical protein HC796_00890 [Synechococcaceae cyanobacterium RL_1_2]|nr:hypothetical protein [Synechococcaceae cyanobacterium RL_1_2]
MEEELIKRINQGWRFLALEQKVGDDLKFELDSERLINIVRRIGDDLKDGKIDFKSAITSIQKQLDQYILFAEKLPEGANKQQFIYQLKMLERNIYVDEQTAMWLNSTAANINQVINGYKAIKSLGYFDENDPVQQKIKEVLMDGEDGVETVLGKIRHLPERLVSNLATIALEAKSKVEDMEEEIKNFNGGLKIWFDHGIARASGVYKRNAKGVSFVIGLVVALAANADTFHMVEQLSIDSDVRGLVLEEATQTIAAYPPEDQLIQSPELPTPTPNSNNVPPPPPPPAIGTQTEDNSNQSATEGNNAAPGEATEVNPTPTSELSQQQIEQMQDRAREITGSFPLPIGWGKDNLDLQKTSTEDWRIGEFYLGWLRIGVGWFVTAVAVSMGAPFWYQILGKVIDIKNIGKKNTSEGSGN